MSYPKDFAIRDLIEAQFAYVTAEKKRANAIRQARKQGCTLAQIGTAIGVTPQRVHQILSPD